mgnify:CR=1 FL=1
MSDLAGRERRSLIATESQRTVRSQIVLGNVVILALAVIAVALTFWQVSRLVQAVNTLETASRRVAVATDTRSAGTSLLADVTRLLPLEDADLFASEVSASLADLEESQAALEEMISQTEDEATLEALSTVQQQVANVVNVTSTMVRQAREEQWPSVRIRVGVLNRDQQQVVSRVNNLVAQVRATEEQALTQVANARRAAILYPLLIGIIALALAALSIRRVTRSIAGPIEQLTAGASRLAGGAFDRRVPVTGEGEFRQLAQAFNQMAERLASYYAVLEERVRERTRDLALAAEVGQRLSQVHELDILLPEAVERIRQRFDLYYTQVYLIDPTGRRLTLYAGTGEVGEELAERGHHLAVDRNSINGMAALEKEAVVISDTTESVLFRPNPLLPETRSEIAVPLLSGDRVVGVLDLQSRESDVLSEEILPAFEVLAGQLAIAIENARLFAEVDRARAELAERQQQTIRSGWEAFLNAIDRDERLVATYTNEAFAVSQSSSENRLSTSITLNNEAIGAIELEAAPELHWGGEQIEIVNRVAEQVAQQVENLRLLAEAQRYREEAEAAIRRLTREGWEAFRQERAAKHLVYEYDGQKVELARPPENEERAIGQPVVIRGESIGELSVADAADETRVGGLVAAVADRLGAHIENLRLSQQTEEALAEAERRGEELRLLNRIVTDIGSTLDLREGLKIVVRELVAATDGNQARVALLNESRTALTIVAEELDPIHTTESALGIEIPVAGNILTQQVLESREAALVPHPQRDPRLAPMHDLFREQGIETMIILPILAGNEVIGTVGIDILEPDHTFSDGQHRLASAIVVQAAAAIQNARLFDQVQEALTETAALYRAGAELNTARTYGEVLDVLRRHTLLGEAEAISALLMFSSVWGGTEQPQWIEIRASSLADSEDTPARFAPADLPALVERLQPDAPLLVPDVTEDEQLEEDLRRLLDQPFETRGTAIVPLVVARQWIGHVVALYPDEIDFSDAELRHLSTLVGQASVAVQSINLLEETNRLLASEQRQRRIADTMLRATERMSGVLDETQIREIMVDEIHNLLRPAQVGLYQWVPGQEAFRVLQQVGVPGARKPRYRVGDLVPAAEAPELGQVFDAGQPTLAAMEEEEGSQREVYRLNWLVGNEFAGVMEVLRPAGAMTMREEDRASIVGMVQQAAIRLQNARLFEESKMRAEELAVLNEMGRALTALVDVDAVIEAAYQYTTRLMDTTNFYIGLYHPEEHMLSFPIAVDNNERVDYSPRPYGSGMTEHLIEMREPLLIAENVTDYLASVGIEQYGEVALSWLGVPLIYGDRALGVIGLQSYTEPYAYNERSREILSSIASQVAISIRNAELFEEIQERVAETRTLYETSRAINTSQGYEDLLETLRAYTFLGEADHVSFNYFDRPWTQTEEPKRIYVLARKTHLPAQTLQSEYDFTTFPSRQYLEKDSAVLIEDVETSPIIDDQLRVLLQQMQAASTLFVPLVAGRQWLGFIHGVYREPTEFSEDEVQRLSALTGQAAVAVQGLRLLEQTQKRAVELETVSKVSAATSTILEGDKLLEAVVELTKRSFNLYHAHIYLLNQPRHELELVAGSGAAGDTMVDRRWHIPVDHEKSLVARAARTREGIIVNDVHADPNFLPNPLLPDTRSEMAVPMIVGNRLLGVLDVQSDEPNYFSDEDVQIQSALASQVAIALQNATLYQEQLKTTEQLLEFDRLKSEFLASMSHELRTPLNSIIGFADVLLEGIDGELNERMEEDVRLIRNSGDHLRNLIGDILDMSKIEAGMMDLRYEKINLQSLGKELESFARSQMITYDKTLDFGVDIGPGVSEITADRTRFKQVLFNLISNAVKFTTEGGVRVQMAAEDGMLQVSVSDTGIGINEENIPIVFEQFRQVDGSLTRTAGGTGLGLPISKSLVELHGGDIVVDSEVGEGTTFTFSVPLDANKQETGV